MAARDRNLFAWQAYVIAMSFVVVGLLVALGFSIASSSNIQKSMTDAVSQSRTANDAMRKLSGEIEYIKGMLGQRQFTEAEWKQMKESAPSDPQFAAVQTQYEKDMSLFGPSEPIQNRNYPKLAEYLMLELRARNAQVDAAAKAYAELTRKTENTVKSETAGREAAEKNAADMEKRLAEERIDFQKKLDADQQTISEVNNTLQKKIAEFAKEKARLDAALKAKSTQADELIARNLSLVERVRILEGEDFQSAQGKIIDVMDGGKIVWVNLGSADGLKPGVRFGIVNPDELRLKEARPKAHVEIHKVIGEHQAQGQVISGELQVPVVKGDLVYSVAWQKGRKVKFALMGKLDLNDDGLDDRQTVKDMILQSGGEITEELTPDGKSIGKMTPDTRWLVVGKDFDVSATEDLDPRQKAYRVKYADMQRRAKELAVSQINMDKLLNWIQSDNSADRSIPMGTATRASDFTDKRRVPSSLGTVSEIYTDRRQSGPYTPARPLDGQPQ
jgi:hypothetical protein